MRVRTYYLSIGAVFAVGIAVGTYVLARKLDGLEKNLIEQFSSGHVSETSQDKAVRLTKEYVEAQMRLREEVQSD